VGVLAEPRPRAKLARVRRRSQLAQAVRHPLARWGGLTCRLDDGGIEIDSKTVERSIRPLTMRDSLCAPLSSICKHWKRVRVNNATRATLSGHRRFHRLRRQIVGPYLMRGADDDLNGRKHARLDQATIRMVCDA